MSVTPHAHEGSNQQATLEGISAHLKRLETKVDALGASAQNPRNLTSEDTETSKASAEDEHSSSKIITGGAIGLIGAKLGALIGAKIGALGATADIKIMDTSGLPVIRRLTAKIAGMMGETAGNASSELHGFASSGYWARIIVNAKVYALAGAMILGVPSLVLGYKRGDRLNKATDLFTKPLNSFHRLVQSEADFIKEHPDHPRAKKETPSGDKYRDLVASQRAEKASEISR